MFAEPLDAPLTPPHYRHNSHNYRQFISSSAAQPAAPPDAHPPTHLTYPPTRPLSPDVLPSMRLTYPATQPPSPDAHSPTPTQPTQPPSSGAYPTTQPTQLSNHPFLTLTLQRTMPPQLTTTGILYLFSFFFFPFFLSFLSFPTLRQQILHLTTLPLRPSSNPYPPQALNPSPTITSVPHVSSSKVNHHPIRRTLSP